jgi:serine/threonine protein kinase
VSRPYLPTPDVGTVLADRYAIVRHIARGGMADVYEAEDQQLRRSVAVKVFRGAAAADRARFDAEVVMLAALSHPGLVQVFDAGDHGDDAFVVLELVNGPNLAARLATNGPVAPAEVADIGAAVADALAYVHERGVVHRDVTPSNVICGPDGRPRLADFGIARLVDTTRVTATSTTVGTAGYMAPEQVQGHDVTPAADVYALGLVLLELLTGHRAFSGTQHEVAVARLVRDPDVERGVPGPWQPLLAAMTDRAPANRPTAVEVRDQLTALVHAADLATSAIAIDPPAPGEAVTRPLESIGGGTTVMPVGLVPVDSPEAEPALTLPGPRRALIATIVGVVLLLLVISAAAGGGGIEPPPAPKKHGKGDGGRHGDD